LYRKRGEIKKKGIKKRRIKEEKRSIKVERDKRREG
jgi:hypothetical protein